MIHPSSTRCVLYSVNLPVFHRSVHFEIFRDIQRDIQLVANRDIHHAFRMLAPFVSRPANSKRALGVQ